MAAVFFVRSADSYPALAVWANAFGHFIPPVVRVATVPIGCLAFSAIEQSGS
jgi:hypothetical protein